MIPAWDPGTSPMGAVTVMSRSLGSPYRPTIFSMFYSQPMYGHLNPMYGRPRMSNHGKEPPPPPKASVMRQNKANDG